MNPPLFCLAPCTPHSCQTRCPDQLSPQFPVEGSEFWFLEAIYSQCSATERTRAGASKEGPPIKEPHGFYICCPSMPKVSLFLFFSPQLLSASECPVPWLTAPQALSYARGQHFTAPCLRLLPPRPQPAACTEPAH